VYEWDTTLLLQRAGFIDSYREIYPDPLANPGYTWPTPCQSSPQEKPQRTGWLDLADERDRIDYVFYKNSPDGRAHNIILKAVDSWIVGTPMMVVGNKLLDESQQHQNDVYEDEEEVRAPAVVVLDEDGCYYDSSSSTDLLTKQATTVTTTTTTAAAAASTSTGQQQHRTYDRYSLPVGHPWPSDHRAVLTVFELE
jgi:hypothetical protein